MNTPQPGLLALLQQIEGAGLGEKPAAGRAGFARVRPDRPALR
ncbi:MAG: hypothetical protein OXU96_06590 [Gammaproteobacteria bacterium]|nr:hypothetical protein [Gammaproteobacteria bacterium]